MNKYGQENEWERRRRERLVGKVRQALAGDDYLNLFDVEERKQVEAALHGDIALESVPIPRVRTVDDIEIVKKCLTEIVGMDHPSPVSSAFLGATIAYVGLYADRPALPTFLSSDEQTRLDSLLKLVGSCSDDRIETKALDNLALQVSTGLCVSKPVWSEREEIRPSALRRVDTGEKPAEVLKPDGTHGFTAGNDLFLSSYEFYKSLLSVYGKKGGAAACKGRLAILLPLASPVVRESYRSIPEKKRLTLEERADKAMGKFGLAIHMKAPVDLLEGAIADGLYQYLLDENVGGAGKLRAIAELERRAGVVDERRMRTDKAMLASPDPDGAIECDSITKEELS